MSLLSFSKFPASSVPVRPEARRGQNPDDGIHRRTLQGTLQEGHRGSAGQGK
ncbi:unnamed protein product [Staurois parvus]|uniref:Uncharacterized protein n=1 Tax=Staurois parvus TaxID=386267 RepID=A0ABN9H959_9NEOB|nr:unnamed protein product [Staurois parvus]